MVLKELKNDFKTEIIQLNETSSIFHTKEYPIGKFRRERFDEIVNMYGKFEVDFYSFEYGVIVLNRGDIIQPFDECLHNNEYC